MTQSDSLGDPLDLFAELRPADVSPGACTGARERILARLRLHMQEAAPPRARWMPALGLALVGVGLGAGLVAMSSHFVEGPPKRTPRQLAPDVRGERDGSPAVAVAASWPSVVGRALEGDAVAREDVLRGGRAAWEACLCLAESGGGSLGPKALELLQSACPVTPKAFETRLGALLRVPSSAPSAAGLLIRARSDSGLEVLAAAAPECVGHETVLLEAMRRAATQHGRREGVFRALLPLAESGDVGCLSLAMEIGGPERLSRLLPAVARSGLAPVELAPVLGRASGSTIRRLAFLAANGHGTALSLLAAGQRLEVVPLLERDVLRAAEGRSLIAARMLASLRLAEADCAIARLAGALPAAHPSRGVLEGALAALDPLRVLELAGAARESARDRPALLEALGRSVAGVEALSVLGRERRLAARVLEALEHSSRPEASAAIESLGAAMSLQNGSPPSGQILAVLMVRLSKGCPQAPDALLALARRWRPDRVLRRLRSGGEAGRACLERALDVPALSARARRELVRMRAERSQGSHAAETLAQFPVRSRRAGRGVL